MHSEDIVFLKNHYDKYSNSMLVPLSLEAYLSSNNFKLNKLIFDWAFVKGTSSSDFHNYSKKINDLILSQENYFININISLPSVVQLICYIKNIISFCDYLNQRNEILSVIIPVNDNYSIAWGGVNTPWILPIVFAFKLKHKIKFISLKHQKRIQRYFVPLVFLLKIMRFIISNIKKGKVKLLSLSLPNGDYNALYDGWGGDLEKTFSLEKTIKELDTNKYNCLHIFYDWQNKNHRFMERFSSAYQFISGSQNLIKIESSFNPKYFKYVYITFKQLKLLTKKIKLDSNYLIRFLLFPFNYISLIEADKYNIIAKNYFSNTKLNTYVSSDGSSRLYRAKMTYAKSKGIKTISVPHGYDLFTEPIGYYLGDKIYTGYGKRKDLVKISGYGLDRIKIKVNRDAKISKKKKMGKILFLFSDTHIRHFDYHPKEFMFFVDLIEYVSINTKRSIELKFHPNLVSDRSYKAIDTYLNNKFKGKRNISINYELKAESEYKDSSIMFSTNVVSSAMVFATFHGVPVYYLKTKWSSVNNYFSLVNSLDNRNSILIDSIPDGARIILSLINSAKEFQGKSLNSFINYQFSKTGIN